MPYSSSAPADALLEAALRALVGPARLHVRLGGISMRPLIGDGTPAAIAPPPEQPRRGMVLVCLRPGGALTIHRVIGRRPAGAAWQVRTKGDALGRDDGWWDPSEVLGQVVAIYRAGRWVALDCGWPAWVGGVAARVSTCGSLLIPAAGRLRTRVGALRRRVRAARAGPRRSVPGR